MQIIVSLLVLVIGLLLYLLSKNGKVAELGRLAFAVGLLVFLLQGIGQEVVSLIHH